MRAAPEVVHGQVSVLYITSLGTSATTVLNSLLLLSHPVLFHTACCLLPQTPRTTQPGQLPVRQRQRHQATPVPPGRAASREGEPERGYQSPPQSSSKLPDSAERCEWLSAVMRLAGRLAGRRDRRNCLSLSNLISVPPIIMYINIFMYYIYCLY